MFTWCCSGVSWSHAPPACRVVSPPGDLAMVGTGILLQARAVRPRERLKGEASAIELGEKDLPFLEYQLNQQLMQKMAIHCMNALFSLRLQVTIGEKFVIGVATATAVHVVGLPLPTPFKYLKDPSVSG